MDAGGENVIPFRSPELGRAEDQWPYCEVSEKALLSVALFDSKRIDDVADRVTPDSFYFPVHGAIWSALVALSGRGLDVLAPAVVDRLKGDPAFEAAGGADYMVDLEASVLSPSSIGDYANRVVEMHRRRQCLSVLQEGMHAVSRDFEVGSEDIVAGIESGLYEVATNQRVEGGLVHASSVSKAAIDHVQRAMEAGGAITGVPTGINSFDALTGGLQPGTLTVLAARPGMGKSAFALNASEFAAKSRKTVAFFTLEMPSRELFQRVLARRTGISIQRQIKGHVDRGDIRRLAHEATDISTLPLYLDETGRVTLAQIANRARRQKRRHGLDMLVIDYLGQIAPADGRANKVHQIEEITSGLKALAKSLSVPVVLLCQLSRKVEERDDKRPTMADLRDSGAIEQDADLVCFLYREEYYTAKDTVQRRAGETDEKFEARYTAWEKRLFEAKGQADLILAKYRQGESCSLPIRWDGVKQEFSDMPDNGVPL